MTHMISDLTGLDHQVAVLLGHLGIESLNKGEPTQTGWDCRGPSGSVRDYPKDACWALLPLPSLH